MKNKRIILHERIYFRRIFKIEDKRVCRKLCLSQWSETYNIADEHKNIPQEYHFL